MATKGVCKDLRRPPNRKVQAVEGQGSSAHPSKPSSFYRARAFLLPQREGGAMSPREAPAPASSSTGQRRESSCTLRNHHHGQGFETACQGPGPTVWP